MVRHTAAPLLMPSRLRRLLSRRVGLAVLTAAAIAVGVFTGTAPQAAADGIVVHGTTTNRARIRTATPLDGLSVSGAGSGQLLVNIATNGWDSVTLPTHDGLTLSGGSEQWSGADLSIIGTQDDVNTALASAELTGWSPGSRQLTISIAPYTSGLYYSSETGHFYRYVSSPGLTWAQVRTAARASTFAGQPGYLAQMPESWETMFFARQAELSGEVFWIGGSATSHSTATTKRVWTWIDGPANGQVFTRCTNLTGTCVPTARLAAAWAWAAGQPDNAGGSEDKAVLAISPLNPTLTMARGHDRAGTNTAGITGYLIEYGGMPNLNGGTGFTGLGRASTTYTITAPPTAPTQVRATVTDKGQYDVTWKPPTTLNGSTITGYTVNVGARTCSTAPTKTYCRFTGLYGNGGSFFVTAHSDMGDSEAAGSAAWFIYGSGPQVTLAVAGDRQALLRWTPAQPLGTVRVTKYRVVTKQSSATCTTRTTSCVVTGLTNGQPYPFRVVAYVGEQLAVGVSNHAFVTPQPVMAVTPTRVLPGSTITVTASGFMPRTTITLRVNGTITKRAIANYNGALDHLATRLPSSTRGTARITVTGFDRTKHTITRVAEVRVT